MSALINYPPMRRTPPNNAKPTVFLAGSIEMGAAVDWQKEAETLLSKHASIIYNPRRPDWDSTWEQKIDSENFNVQVNWELDMLSTADLVVFYFDPNTKSPITLMELGSRRYGAVVYCPEGFWRKGNVDIFCERSRIPVFDDPTAMFDAAILALKKIRA